VGGVADAVIDGSTGLITPPGDADAFAAALLRFTEDEQLRNTFGKRGVQQAREHYSYQRLVKDMSLYYHTLLEQQKNRRKKHYTG
jgi:glycosyltransferase involved in cell wall biosynthesis